MKKLALFILIACISAAVLLCSCGDAEVSDTPRDGEMTAVTDESGNISGYERRFHNDNGDITRLDVYDKDQVYLSYVLYAYDDSDRLLSETYYRADGIATSRTVYSYDENGNLYEKAFEQPNGEATVERYDAAGELIEKLYYNTDEKLTVREVLENGEWKIYEATESPTE